MTDGAITNFYEHKPPADVKPQQMVILLHGLGADGRDLFSLAPIFAQDLPETVFISPDAPFRCDMAPMGYQWFSFRFAESDPESLLQGVETAAPILEDFIDQQLEKYEISANNLVLLGFSQGTMMSLYTGPRYKQEIAGILGYSGALIGGEGFVEDPEEFHKPPVHLVHGEADTVVPVGAWHEAKEKLENAGFEVSGYTTSGLGHGIDQDGVESGAAFLRKVISS